MASARIQKRAMALVHMNSLYHTSFEDSMVTLTSSVIYHFQTCLQMLQLLANLINECSTIFLLRRNKIVKFARSNMNVGLLCGSANQHSSMIL